MPRPHEKEEVPMKFKHLFAGVAAIGLLAGTAWLFREPVSLAVASRMMEKRMGGDALAELPDGLHVGLCGAGSPFPDDLRSGPCTLVVAGQRMMVFDAGSGAARNIGKMGFNHGRIAAVFLTHFHSDHIDGLGELMLQRWVTTSNVAPLPVHGPAGVQQVVGGLMQAYAQDQHYRVAHHGQPTVPASGFGGNPVPFQLGADGRAVLVKDADLEVVAFTVDHAPVHPSVGYRIQYKGRTVVLSGDTRKSPAVQREAANVDLLVHEALSVRLVQLLADGAAGSQPVLLRRTEEQTLYEVLEIDPGASDEEIRRATRRANDAADFRWRTRGGRRPDGDLLAGV